MPLDSIFLDLSLKSWQRQHFFQRKDWKIRRSILIYNGKQLCLKGGNNGGDRRGGTGGRQGAGGRKGTGEPGKGRLTKH